MSKKSIIVLIGIFVLGFGSYTFWKMKMHPSGEVRETSKRIPTSQPENEVSDQAASPKNTNVEPESEEPKEGEKTFKSMLTAGQRSHLKDYFEVTESEEFQKFLETNPTLEERFNFLSDRGIGDLRRNLNMSLFRESFPTGDPADFEPEMREKLKQMLIAGGVGPIQLPPPSVRATAQALTAKQITYIDDLVNEHGVAETVRRLRASDPDLAVMFQYGAEGGLVLQKARDIIREFWREDRTFHWQMGYFKGRVIQEGGSYYWAEAVLAEVTGLGAASSASVEPPDAVSLIENEALDTTENSGVADVPIQQRSDTAESMGDSLPVADGVPEGADAPARSAADSTNPFTGVETEFSDLFTVESFETALREKFSAQRFATGMQLLNRFGPEEGLRRLKASDPDLAEQIEPHLRKFQEEQK